MQIKEIMTRDVAMVQPADSIREAARRMRDHDVGSLPVTDGDRLVGHITDRDIVIRALAGLGGPETLVSAVMSDRVLYCFDDEAVEEVARNMAENQVRRLPVVNRDKQLCGIVALGDFATRGASEPAEEALEGISARAA